MREAKWCLVIKGQAGRQIAIQKCLCSLRFSLTSRRLSRLHWWEGRGGGGGNSSSPSATRLAPGNRRGNLARTHSGAPRRSHGVPPVLARVRRGLMELCFRRPSQPLTQRPERNGPASENERVQTARLDINVNPVRHLWRPRGPTRCIRNPSDYLDSVSGPRIFCVRAFADRVRATINPTAPTGRPVWRNETIRNARSDRPASGDPVSRETNGQSTRTLTRFRPTVAAR